MPPCEFHWIIEPDLAGCGQPGLLSEATLDYAWLHSVGIRHVVCLTEKVLDPPSPACGITGHHFPIIDMSFPMPRPMDALCARIAGWIAIREPAVVHCRAGLGRTGLVLACFLVYGGMSAERAIRVVRSRCSRYIQTAGQERFIHHYQAFRSETESRVGVPPGNTSTS